MRALFFATALVADTDQRHGTEDRGRRRRLGNGGGCDEAVRVETEAGEIGCGELAELRGRQTGGTGAELDARAADKIAERQRAGPSDGAAVAEDGRAGGAAEINRRTGPHAQGAEDIARSEIAEVEGAATEGDVEPGRDLIGRAEGERAGVDRDGASVDGRATAVVEDECAGVDGGRAGVGVGCTSVVVPEPDCVTATVPLPLPMAVVVTLTAPVLLKVTVFVPVVPAVMPPEMVRALVLVVAAWAIVRLLLAVIAPEKVELLSALPPTLKVLLELPAATVTALEKVKAPLVNRLALFVPLVSPSVTVAVEGPSAPLTVVALLTPTSAVPFLIVEPPV